MEDKKLSTFIFTVTAIILGVTLYKQFDFENLKFEKTGLAIVYLIAFIMSVYFLIRNYKKQTKK